VNSAAVPAAFPVLFHSLAGVAATNSDQHVDYARKMVVSAPSAKNYYHWQMPRKMDPSSLPPYCLRHYYFRPDSMHSCLHFEKLTHPFHSVRLSLLHRLQLHFDPRKR